MLSLLLGCVDLPRWELPDAPEIDRAVVDETVEQTDCFVDADGDGWGGEAIVVAGASCGSGTVATGGDCDDGDAATAPDQAEQCDGRDNNCDGVVDQPVPAEAPSWYADADGDGFGHPATGVSACEAPDTYIDDASDCDDDAADAFPGGIEVCEDGLDNDCAGNGDALCRLIGALAVAETTDATWRGEAAMEALGLSLVVGDLDLDGRDDLLAGSWTVERETRFRGFTDPLLGGTSSDARLTLEGSEGVSWDRDAFAVVATLDPVGCGAVTIGGESGAARTGTVWILPGCAGTLSEADAVVEGSEDGAGLFGQAVAAVEDSDGDGAAELLVGASGGVTMDGEVREEHGRVYLFQDPLHELDAADADARFDTPASAEWMALGGVLCAADFDGDGLSDLAMSAPGYDLYSGGALPSWAPNGAVFVAFAPVEALTDLAGDDGTPGASVAMYTSGETDRTLGSELACRGDVDGDGLPELVIGDPYQVAGGRVYVATPTSPGSTPVDTLPTQFTANATFESLGGALESGGDFDGDGRKDLALRAMNEAGTDGVVHLFYAVAAGMYTTADSEATISEGTMLAVGDFNGDGVSDLVVGRGVDSTVALWSGSVDVLLGGGGSR